MALDPITGGEDLAKSVLGIANDVLDRLIPDKTQAAAAKAQLLEMQVKGDIDARIAQIQVDNTEASSKSVFVAGWRPFVGWACGGAFVYAFIVQPFAQFVAVLCHSSFDATKLPQLNLAEMMPVLLGMLGLGAMRSFDKTQGTDNGH